MHPFILLSGSPPSKPLRSLKKATRFNIAARERPERGSVSIEFSLIFCSSSAMSIIGQTFTRANRAGALSLPAFSPHKVADANRDLRPSTRISPTLERGHQLPSREGAEAAICASDEPLAVADRVHRL